MVYSDGEGVVVIVSDSPTIQEDRMQMFLDVSLNMCSFGDRDEVTKLIKREKLIAYETTLEEATRMAVMCGEEVVDALQAIIQDYDADPIDMVADFIAGTGIVLKQSRDDARKEVKRVLSLMLSEESVNITGAIDFLPMSISLLEKYGLDSNMLAILLVSALENVILWDGTAVARKEIAAANTDAVAVIA